MHTAVAPLITAISTTLAAAFHPNDRRILFLFVMLCPRSRFFPCDP